MFIVAEHLLREAGVRVLTVKEQFSDDVNGFVNKSMTRFVDAMYVENVRAWTKTKMEQMVAQGYHCGGYPPFGYRKVFAPGMQAQNGKEPPKVLVPCEGDAQIVAQAYALFAECRTLAIVRDWLTAHTTRRWTTTTTKNLLTNEAYTGVQQFGQWRNEQSHPPLVSLETYAAVQEVLPLIAGRYTPRAPEGSFAYYLRGRVHCPHCGCPYTQAAHHGRSGPVHYYTCLSARKGRAACPVARVNAQKLHDTVLGVIVRGVTGNAYVQQAVAGADWGGVDQRLLTERGALGKRRQLWEMKRKNYVDAIGEGRALTTLLPALEKAEAELRVIEGELEQAEQRIASHIRPRPTASQVRGVWECFAKAWRYLEEDERTAVLGGLVRRVSIESREWASVETEVFAGAQAAMHKKGASSDFSPNAPSDWFALAGILGAGVGLEPTTSGL